MPGHPCSTSRHCAGTALAPCTAPSSAPAMAATVSVSWPDPGLIGAISPDRVLHDDVYWIAEPLPAYHRRRVAIPGDAAHAMTPHLGQGACQAIEDAVVLASVAGPGTPATAPADATAPANGAGPDLAAYTAARLPRTRMVANGSYRATRLSGMTSPAAIALRNTGIRLAGRLAPSLMLRQMDPLASWTPPAPAGAS